MPPHPRPLIHAVRRLATTMTPIRRVQRDFIHDDPDTGRSAPGLTGMETEEFIPGPVVPIHICRTGPANPSVTVVYIHGFTLAAESFFQQVNDIRQAFDGVAQLLLDIRGHGKTGAVATDELSIDGAADDVLTAIRSHAPTGKLVIVGHSLGGMIAMSAIRRAETTIANRLYGLVLVDAAAEPIASCGVPAVLDTALGKEFISAMSDSPQAAGKLRDKVSSILAPALAATVFHRDGLHYDIVEFHASMIANTPTSTLTGFSPALRTHAETQSGPYLQPLQGSIIVGEKDEVTPLQQSEALHRLWPAARLITVPRCGHMTILEAPEVVSEAIADLLVGLPGVTVTGSLPTHTEDTSERDRPDDAATAT